MKPLAERMRPHNFDDFVGQQHLVGKGGPIRLSIEKNNLPSMIFWGPPGSGKTTLAKMIAELTGREYFQINAVESGVKQIRDVVDHIKQTGPLLKQITPVLFIDEIHRFSKTQQDALLNIVENGTVVLIAATTENPSFEIINPLLSRCQIYVLNLLEEEDIKMIVNRAIENDEELNQLEYNIISYEALLHFAAGDARKALNIIEMLTGFAKGKRVEVTDKNVEQLIQKRSYAYDKKGENHYDIISAFIKSLRGSDPDAAVYWLVRMLEGGEDIQFIARRMLILAAEDIGLANPNALLLANSCFQSVSVVGMPEARIILSEVAVYLATSPKSNATYLAIKNAEQKVKQTGPLAVPLHLRNSPTKMMKEMGYGKGYKYAHDYKDNYVAQQNLPEEIKDEIFYKPGMNAKEQNIKKYMEQLKTRKDTGK